ncbi:uncharacterized protein SOCE26_012240 [Sorangium cellulosum]|uniref:Follistatin-like domain-containing protein n=1 Tax=Sorangium cellulosum TaxID=56 RepID=A0A2L0EKL5_SORCE|nr:hypothetical protein [Sorangium cellulosum]AUX39829.1 uncharacterized protein SOCE26_012240 [Sorangium cellulosum]
MVHKTMLRSTNVGILSLLSALAALLPACGASPAEDLDQAEEGDLSEQTAALGGIVTRHDACAAVRCRDGFLCEEQDGRPVCVPVPPPPPVCETDADCSLVANYCGGCNCNAVPSGEPEPKCTEGEVACLVWPCQGLEAACQAGRCVIANEN